MVQEGARPFARVCPCEAADAASLCPAAVRLRFVLTSVPDDDHRSTTAYARSAEGRPCPNICMARSGYERPRGQAGSPIRTEHGVDRLPHVRMPSRRAYLIPQFRTPQSPVTHYQHGHVLRHRFGQDSEHVHYRVHPLAGRVGGHDAPGKGNGAASVDCAYHDRGHLIALHRRVYGKQQSVRLPQLQQRNEARVHVQLHSARVGAVLSVVEPLSEVLADAVLKLPMNESAVATAFWQPLPARMAPYTQRTSPLSWDSLRCGMCCSMDCCI